MCEKTQKINNTHQLHSSLYTTLNSQVTNLNSLESTFPRSSACFWDPDSHTSYSTLTRRGVTLGGLFWVWRGWACLFICFILGWEFAIHISITGFRHLQVRKYRLLLHISLKRDTSKFINLLACLHHTHTHTCMCAHPFTHTHTLVTGCQTFPRFCHPKQCCKNVLTRIPNLPTAYVSMGEFPKVRMLNKEDEGVICFNR
jgi:hypothetical protein